MKPVIIWNPAAGRGRARRRWATFEAEMHHAGVVFEALTTERRGHARDLAARAVRDGASRLAAFGGDGTLHEVAEGVIASGDAAVAFLPAGTSCDFSRRLPRSSWLARLQSHTVREIDVVRIDCHDAAGRAVTAHAVNGANIGFVAAASAYFASLPLPAFLGADALAIASAFSAIRAHRPIHATVSIDGRTAESMALANATIYKTPSLAGGMRLPAIVDSDDGKAGFLFFATERRLPLLSIIPSLYRGRLDRHPRIRTGSAHELSVSTDTPAAIEADGEIVGFTPATFRTRPLRVVF